jgi:hypothetical protein
VSSGNGCLQSDIEQEVHVRLASRLTYANVMATLAVFIALGGSSYALIELPRNSVGSTQIKRGAVGPSEIRTNAVRSRDVKRRSLRLSDLSKRARGALRGRTGAPGPPGSPGTLAAKFFAAVAASGEPARGNVTSFEHTVGGSGSYTLGFAQNVSACAYAATLGTTNATNPPAGRIAVRDDGGRVGVQTYDAGGSPADLPFHLIVAC